MTERKKLELDACVRLSVALFGTDQEVATVNLTSGSLFLAAISEKYADSAAWLSERTHLLCKVIKEEDEGEEDSVVTQP
jgi:hypothetical protein